MVFRRVCEISNPQHLIISLYIAFKDLKEKLNLSLGQISIKTGLSKSFLSDIANNKVLPPKDEYVEKIAKALKVEPEYFFEYRKRRLSEFCEENREFLDICLEQSKKYKKGQREAKEDAS
jgi:transcriptional regulator with XRE-family HTH domain